MLRPQYTVLGLCTIIYKSYTQMLQNLSPGVHDRVHSVGFLIGIVVASCFLPAWPPEAGDRELEDV